MSRKIKRIGILTSGGDGPGMNAAIRAIVRTSLSNGLETFGVIRGYDGLIDDDIVPLNHRSVSNIINRGGTIIKTARSPRFKTPAGMRKAIATLKKHKLDALVTIGGDGTYLGASELFRDYRIPTVGVPGTIDNDLYGTDETIGCETAVNTAMESIDKIRDTAHSMERIFVIEVMGNKSGYIAMQVALGSGSEEVIVPGRPFNYPALYKDMTRGSNKGKVSYMIVVAEGAARAQDVAQKITKETGRETRFVVLGHVQRGGSPVSSDRILATRMGAKAVELLLEGKLGKAVGVVEERFKIVDLSEARRLDHMDYDEAYKLLKTLT